MPEILDRCVKDVMNQGKSEEQAWGICRTALGMSKNEDYEEVMSHAKELCDKKFSLETFDVNGVEIFATGNWNGDTYTDSDLKNMADGFVATRGMLKPYLKLGHDGKQKLLQKDGLPAAGWVENLRKVGNKLVADFKRVPKAIYELIKAGAYRRVSSEIYWNSVVGGKKYPYLLKAVSLLGGDTPAVGSLEDIMALYVANGEAMTYKTDAESKIYSLDTSEFVSKEDAQMEKELKETQEKLAEATRKLTEAEGKAKEYADKTATLEKENSELKGKVEASDAQVKKFNDEKRALEINGKIDKLIEEKKLLPAQRELLFAILSTGDGVKKYKVGNEELDEEQAILKFVELNAESLSTHTQSGAGDAHRKGDFEKEREELDKKARLYMEEQKKEGRTVSYSDALVAVSPGRD